MSKVRHLSVLERSLTLTILAVLAVLLPASQAAAICTVTSTADTGAGSLRQAIDDANLGSCSTIEFAIAGAGPHTITLDSALILTAGNVTINGYSQPSSAANSAAFGSAVDADWRVIVETGAGYIDPLMLELQGGSNVVRGLHFRETQSSMFFPIDILGITGNGNQIAGSRFEGGASQISIPAASITIVGGANPADRNVLTGAGADAILIDFAATGSELRGNYIGIMPNGTTAAGSQGAGIVIGDASGTIIDQNVVSGNGLGDAYGIVIGGSNNTISNNRVGTNAAGTAAIGNGAGPSFGIAILGNPSSTPTGNTISGNLISGHATGYPSSGIILNFTTSNTITGNKIGTDLTGTASLPNTFGVLIDGQFNPASDNRIDASSSPNLIANNQQDGIAVIGASALKNVLSGNVIRGNGDLPVDLGNDGATINDAGDADTGPNNLQNFATIDSATYDAGTSTLTTTVSIDSSATSAASMRVELFSSDASGNLLESLGSQCIAGSSFSARTIMISTTAAGVGSNIRAHTTSYSDASCTTVLDGTSEGTGATVAGAVLNQPPVAVNDSATTNEDTTVTIDVLANDSDPEDGKPTVTAVTAQPSNGSAAIVAAKIEYTPSINFNGSDSFTYRVEDSGGSFTTATVTITVNAVNDAPGFTPGPDVDVAEDSGAYAAPWATAISAGPTNESSQNVTFEVTNDNNTLFATQPAVGPTGTLAFTPADDASGSALVTVTLRDDGGVTNGGSDASATVTFTITVNAVNDAPSFTPGAAVDVAEDSGAYAAPWATAISAGPADESSQNVTFEVTNDNNTLFATQPAVGPTGTLAFTPADDTSGSALVTVTLRDDGGVTNGGSDASATVTFTIKVTAVNDPPTADPQSIMTNEDEPLGITLAGSDPENDSLTFEIETQPEKGSLTGTAPALTYTPKADFNGSDSFTFSVDDGKGGSDTATVSITVTAVNDAPVLSLIGNKTVVVRHTLRFTLTAIDPDAGDTLTYGVADSPAGATFDTATGVFSWSPGVNDTGAYSVTFSVSDDLGASDSETITITVQENDQWAALVALFEATGGRGWKNHTGWWDSTAQTYGAPGSECDWYGVMCGGSGRVWRLDLNRNQLSGDLPAEIADLTALLYLNVYDNQLTSLPSEIGTLPSLGALVVGGNRLKSLPAAIGTLPSLHALVADRNELVSLPSEIWSLRFNELNLRSNKLTGAVPKVRFSDSYPIVVLDYNALYSTEPSMQEYLDSNQTLAPTNPSAVRLTASSAQVSWSASAYADGYEISTSTTGPARAWSLPVKITGETTTSTTIANLPTSGTWHFRIRAYKNPHTRNRNRVESEYTASFTADSANRAPDLAPIGNKSMMAGQTLGFTISATDPDENDTLTYTMSDAPAGATLNATTGEFSWATSVDDAGASYRVTFTASDQQGGTDSETITVEVQSTQWHALVAIFDATDGPNWRYRGGWWDTTTGQYGAPGSECSWLGVECREGKVVELELVQNSLAGDLPAEIGDLASLKILDLHDNLLTSLPAEIGNLAGLETMKLNNNLLASLPPEMANLRSLVELDLQKNSLTTLPLALTTLEAAVNLRANKILGPISATWTRLDPGSLDRNALFPADSTVANWLGSGARRQTLAPIDLTVTASGATSATLAWKDSASYTGSYKRYLDGYEIWTSSGSGNWTLASTVQANQSDLEGSSATISGLDPSPIRYFRIRAYKDPHEGNKNRVESDFTPVVSTGPNQPPIVSKVPGRLVRKGQEVRFTISAADPDGDTLIWSMPSSSGTSATLNSGNGEFFWTPPDPGTFTFDFTVTDGGSGAPHTVAGSFTLLVEPAANYKASVSIQTISYTIRELNTDPYADAFRKALMASLASPPRDTVIIIAQTAAAKTATATAPRTEAHAQSDLTVTPSALVFDASNWDTPQFFAFAGVGNDDASGASDVSVSLSVTSDDPDYDGYPIPDVELTLVDDDVTEIVVAADRNLQTSEDEDEAVFEVALSRAPLSPVTVTVTSSDPTEGVVETETITFFPEFWSEVETVFVIGVDDDQMDGNRPYTIELTATSEDPAYDGIVIERVEILNLDDEDTSRRRPVAPR